MMFTVEGEGTILVGVGVTSMGTYTQRMKWATPAELAENRDRAERQMREMFDERGEAMEAGQGHFIRRLGRGFSLYIGSGPPTWWRPRLHWHRYGDCLYVGAGWLRRLYSLRVPRP